MHLFYHLWEFRRRTGPLWMTSAEAFESYYAVVRRCYTCGTRNIPKQILENIFMRIK